MGYREEYRFWSEDPFFDEATRAELAAITDEKEIEDRTSSSARPDSEESWAPVRTG